MSQDFDNGNLITSRQPGDLAIFTTAILSRLGYGGKAAALPEETDPNADWWKLADSWGGSSKGEITQGLNTALAGERYAQEAFDQYAQKTSDEGLRNLLKEIIANKQYHIKKLEESWFFVFLVLLDRQSESSSSRSLASKSPASKSTKIEINNFQVSRLPIGITNRNYQSELPIGITNRNYQSELPIRITNRNYQSELPIEITLIEITLILTKSISR